MADKPNFLTAETWSTMRSNSTHQQAWANLKRHIALINQNGSCDIHSLQKSIRIIMNQSSRPSLDMLRNMYILFSCQGKEALCFLYDGLKEYIQFKANELSINEEDTNFCLSSLQTFLDTVCHESFSDVGNLVGTVDRTFLQVLIKNYPVELLAKDLDEILSSEQEWKVLIEKLDKALILCHTIKADLQRQDSFMSLYKTKLVLRHKFGKNAALEGELYMIDKLHEAWQLKEDVISKCKHVLQLKKDDTEATKQPMRRCITSPRTN